MPITKRSSTEVIPLTKRPIEKMTTRSQNHYQQMLDNLKTDGLRDFRNDRNNNSTGLVTDKVGSSSSSTDSNRASNLDKPASGSATGKAAIAQQIGCRPPPTPRSLSCTFPPPVLVLDNPDYAKQLTTYERKEILDYSRVFFIGKPGIKKLTPQTSTTYKGADGFDSKVYGFDDDNGSYLPVMHDHIAYRYEVLKIIGKGTFGIVLQAYDHLTTEKVALKVIRNQNRFHVQAKEEIEILKRLREHDVNDKFNVVHIFNNFKFRNHPCIVFELLSLNLFELSRKSQFNGFTVSLIKRFAYSILRCLEALYDQSIIHCDLKPENVLLRQSSRSGIKVIDFGSSCFANKRIHTYIQSRYYRSPEVILGGKYTMAIDMWSLGCILAELFVGAPLLDGDNEGDQLTCMIELLGMPSGRFLHQCKASRVRQYFDDVGPTYRLQSLNTWGQHKSPRGKIRGPPGSRALLPTCKNETFKQFVLKCLEWDPEKRMTPAKALKHPWLTKI